MDRRIDLHTHSTASDGSMSPRELVRHAKESGLSAIAITDHDTIDGVEEALDEGAKLGIEVLAGVEVSVDFEPEMHILGYFFGSNYKNIAPTLVKLKKSRDERNPKMVEKLKSLGFDITMEEVQAEAKGNIVARPHMASVLFKKGYVKSIREAFDKYIAEGKPAFVKKENPPLGAKIDRAERIEMENDCLTMCFPDNYVFLDSLMEKQQKEELERIAGRYYNCKVSLKFTTSEASKPDAANGASAGRTNSFNEIKREAMNSPHFKKVLSEFEGAELIDIKPITGKKQGV